MVNFIYVNSTTRVVVFIDFLSKLYLSRYYLQMIFRGCLV